MHPRLSNKILRPDFQGEFTASILAAAASPELISFAGGLPNPVSFPVEEMDKAAHKVLEHNGVMALQYSGTQGYQPLREWIAKRYETMGVSGVQADDIIITNGSQQVLTMMGACMLDPGDKVIVEDPTYLVALQSFHFFDPEILPVTINPDGIDCGGCCGEPGREVCLRHSEFPEPHRPELQPAGTRPGRGDLPRHGHCRARG